MAAVCGARRGVSATTVQSALAQANPCPGRHGHHLGEQGHAVGALPHGVGVGEVPAEVAQAHRAQHGVGQRVAHGVGVAVTAETPGALDHHAAQDERAVRVLGEAVHVDALSDAHAHGRPGRQQSLGRRRSSGSVILRLPGSPGTTSTGRPPPPPAWRRRWRRPPAPRRGPAAARRPGRPAGSAPRPAQLAIEGAR